MKIHTLAVALIVSVALAAPAEAAAKKRKKEMQRAPVGAYTQSHHPNDVYFAGEVVGRDPDPFIRLMILRNPNPWDGPN